MPRFSYARALRSIARSLDQITDVLRGRATPRRQPAKPRTARGAQLRLHGRYLGHLRHLSASHKGRVKAVRAKKGYDAAIALAVKLGRS